MKTRLFAFVIGVSFVTFFVGNLLIQPVSKQTLIVPIAPSPTIVTEPQPTTGTSFEPSPSQTLPSRAPSPSPSPSLKSVAVAVAESTTFPVRQADAQPSSRPSVPTNAYITMNLYREGVFVTQKTWYWCVPTSTQIMINIIQHRTDHTYATELAMWKVAWANIKYRGVAPKKYGSDPQGWVAALEAFGAGDYHWVTSTSFASAIKSSVRAVALAHRPVGILAAHGGHAWVLHGFTATADPAKTNDFKVLYVFVSGPLYPMQQKNGYDMTPNTRLTLVQFENFFTVYRDRYFSHTIWTGYYVTIQPR